MTLTRKQQIALEALCQRLFDRQGRLLDPQFRSRRETQSLGLDLYREDYAPGLLETCPALSKFPPRYVSLTEPETGLAVTIATRIRSLRR